MSQFGAKNAGAWARPPGGSSQLNPGLFQNTLITGQPFAQMGMINAAAFSQQAANMNLNLLSAAQAVRVPQPAKKRTFSGVVTKMHDSYGFIDEDVFFQTSMVRGAVPRAGDRVMVEAAYNPSMPFKWNAHFVQLISDKNPAGESAHASPSSTRTSRSTWAIPMDKPRPSPLAAESRGRPGARSPPSARRRSPPRPVPVPEPVRRANSPRRMSPPRPPPRRSPPRRSPPRELRNALARMSPKHNTPHRLMEPIQGKREHSSTSLRTHSPTQKRDTARDSISPPRRRARTIPRYLCYIPKVPVFGNGVPYTVIQLRRRYPSLYIPSDFTEAKFEWPIKTPIENPITFTPSPVTFHIAHRDVDCPCPENDPLPVLNPPDSDYRYYTKVILMCHPGWSNLHQKAFGLLADGSIDDSIEPLSLKRCLHFVVGTRGKDLMALGGAWSPSLDGANPESDPQVLVRTAIRTVRALTGVDLSKCPKWYKMAELRYYRADKDRTDTCALLFPDTSGLMPSAESYEQLTAQLKEQLASKLASIDAQKLILPSSVAADVAGADQDSTTTAAATASGEGDGTPAAVAQQGSDAVGKEQVEDTAEDEDDEDLHPTHWSKLDIKSMKVAELRQELMARELETKGVKSVLCTRLQEALNAEKSKEEGVEPKAGEEKVDTVEEEKMEEKELTEEDKKALEKFEKEKKDKKASLERHFNISKEPGILVFPNRLAKGGKFDCKIVNLVTLLDYRIEDNKEHSFELGILAECISEMLDRSQAFAVYKALCSAVDKETEKKRRRDAKIAEVLGTVEESESSEAVKEEPKEEEKKNEMSEEEKKKEEEKKQKEQEKKEEEQRKALAEPRKPVVAERAIFQAFAHFDQNLCGYINEKDLEDVLYSIGINMSRSQAQKLLKKFLSRDRINYRYLTESWISKDGTVSYKPGYLPDPPSTEELIKGNVPKVGDETKAAKEEPSSAGASETIIYNGAVMNIAQLLEQVAKAEVDRNNAVQQLDLLEAQLKEGNRNVQMLEKKKKRLEEDVDKYRKRLHDAEKCLKNSVDDTVQMKTAIQDFRKMGERMIFVAEKLMPTAKDDKKAEKEKGKEANKKESNEEKDDKKMLKKKESDETKANGEVEEKKELQLVDEVGGADGGDEPMDTEIVLSEEVTGDDEKETKKAEHPEAGENPVPEPNEPAAVETSTEAGK